MLAKLSTTLNLSLYSISKAQRLPRVNGRAIQNWDRYIFHYDIRGLLCLIRYP
jgi:hypothetical protein